MRAGFIARFTDSFDAEMFLEWVLGNEGSGSLYMRGGRARVLGQFDAERVEELMAEAERRGGEIVRTRTGYKKPWAPVGAYPRARRMAMKKQWNPKESWTSKPKRKIRAQDGATEFRLEVFVSTTDPDMDPEEYTERFGDFEKRLEAALPGLLREAGLTPGETGINTLR